MDLVREELKKKRQKLADETGGGKKYFKRHEIEQKSLQKLREEEKRELLIETKSNSNDQQPITVFGEDDDAARLRRLKFTIKAGGVFEVDSDRKRMINSSGVVDSDEEDMKRLKTNFEDLCDEDKILVFFKRILMEWKQKLDDDDTKEIDHGKRRRMATFKQCSMHLNPLFNLCRKKIVPDDIRRGLLIMVDSCMKRDYLAAKNQYIKMAIGNAPWPIGVTMVGIHERSAREKICSGSSNSVAVAHIMNDETTRKYLQSVKSLMTFFFGEE